MTEKLFTGTLSIKQKKKNVSTRPQSCYIPSSLSFILEQTPQQSHGSYFQFRCDFALDNRIDVAVTNAMPHCRSRNATGSQGTSSVRSTYSTIRHSIASDTFWISKVCHRYAMTMLHTPHIRDRLTYHVAVAYQAIQLRSYYVYAALHTYLRRKCDVRRKGAAILLNI